MISGGCAKKQPPEAVYADAREKMLRAELPAAKQLVDEAYRQFRQKSPEWEARFRVLQGEILLREGQSRRALTILDPDIPGSLANDDVAVRRLVAQGVAHFRLQEFREAQHCFNEAQQQASKEKPELRAEVAINRGTFFAFQDDFQKAKTEYRKAMDYASGPDKEYLQSNALGGLGFVDMRQGKYDEAIDWFNASLALATRLGNQSLQAVTLGNLGECYYRLGDLEKASELFVNGADVFRNRGMPTQQQVLLDNLGVVSFDQQMYGRAEDYFRQALSIARTIQNQDAIAVALNNLAAVAIENGQLQAAENYTSEALKLYQRNGDHVGELETLKNQAQIAAAEKNYDRSERYLRRVVKDTASTPLRWSAEAELAKVYAFQNHQDDANHEFQEGLATIDEARASLNVEEHRLSFLTSASRFYSSYIDFLIDHGQVKDALRIAEHSRARTLAEGLGLKPVTLNSTLAPEGISRQSGAVILEYWLKPGRSYLWAVTPNNVALFKLPADTEINAAVQDYRKALLGPRDPLETANASGRKLYDMLVAPAQKLIRSGARVIIIADGALNNLNFETLIAPAPKPHYWIEDVTLSDASSLTLLAGSRRQAVAHGNQLLLVGDPLSASPEYPRLPQAATEIDRVEQHFPAKARLVLEGPQATPQAYLASDTARFSYVHFVAHGTASRTTPLESAVILSPQGDSYKLYARDIVTKPLHADLVTISTCYGAGSRAYTGEGLVGLSWAFLRAGAHNTIAALWEVNDASTAQLMDQLYAGIDKGRDPAIALRAAKLAMLHSAGVYRRPFYWAPFQLYQGSSGADPKLPPRTPSGDD